MVSYLAAFKKNAAVQLWQLRVKFLASSAMRVVRFPGRSTADKGSEGQGSGPKASNAGVAGHRFCLGGCRSCDFLRHELRNAPGTARDG
jgi:hypothetical protein